MKADLFKVDDRRMKNAIKKSLKILKTKNPDSFNIASKAIYLLFLVIFIKHNLNNRYAPF